MPGVDDPNEVAETTERRDRFEVPMWTDNPNLKDFQFSGDSGLKLNLASDNPIDFFNLFLTDQVLENIVIETNKYAEQLFLDKNN